MENREPTSEEISQMAMAACTAASEKCKELGLDLIWHVLGIERAYDATCKVLDLITALGPKGAAALAETINKSQKYDMMKEAEEVLNGD